MSSFKFFTTKNDIFLKKYMYLCMYIHVYSPTVHSLTHLIIQIVLIFLDIVTIRKFSSYTRYNDFITIRFRKNTRKPFDFFHNTRHDSLSKTLPNVFNCVIQNFYVFITLNWSFFIVFFSDKRNPNNASFMQQ